MIRHLLVGLIVLSASTASAGVIGGYTINRLFTTPDTALTGHTGYALSVMTDDGSKIWAVDVNITGRLHQRWFIDPEFGETTPTPSGTSVTNGDSHLTPIAGALFGSEAREDNSGVGSPLPDTATRDYGYGTFLRGAWGIPSASQTNNANIGYVVIPENEVPNLNINVSVGTSNGTFAINKFAFVPLPTLASNPAVGPGVELNFGDYLGLGPNPAPLPNSITLAGPHAAYFTLVGPLPTTLDFLNSSRQFGVKPIVPLPGGTGDLTAVVQVRTDAGNLDFDVLLKVPEPSTLVISTLAIGGLALLRRK